MDEVLLKQLVRQLKLLNFWITFFGSLIVIGLIITGFFAYKAISYAQDAANNVETFQRDARETLNFSDKICNDNNIGSVLRDQTEVCKQ